MQPSTGAGNIFRNNSLKRCLNNLFDTLFKITLTNQRFISTPGCGFNSPAGDVRSHCLSSCSASTSSEKIKQIPVSLQTVSEVRVVHLSFATTRLKCVWMKKSCSDIYRVQLIHKELAQLVNTLVVTIKVCHIRVYISLIQKQQKLNVKIETCQHVTSALSPIRLKLHKICC